MHTFLVLRNVDVCALIDHISHFRYDTEAVCKSGRNPECARFVLLEYHADPLSERGRSAPDVDGDVEHSTANHRYKLALRTRELEMQSAKHPMIGARVVVLSEVLGKAKFGELLIAVDLAKESALVAEDLRLHYHNLG